MHRLIVLLFFSPALLVAQTTSTFPVTCPSGETASFEKTKSEDGTIDIAAETFVDYTSLTLSNGKSWGMRRFTHDTQK